MWDTPDIKRPEVLQFFSFHLRPLNEKVTQVGSSEIHFDLDGKAARSRNSPEFLLPSNLEPGTLLSFEFEIGSKFSTWKDTLFVELQPGLDQTPPRFTGFLQTRLQEEGVAICLPKRQVLDGSAIQLAAVSYSIKDTTELAVIPMHLQVDHYKGIWSMAQPGTYLMAGVAEDLAGNQNRSPLQELFVPVQEVKGESTSPGSWELLGPPGEHWYGGVHSIGISPSNPNVLYAATLTRLWRSMDGGASWTQTGLMFSGDYTAQQNRILVDAQTPSTVYLSTEFLRSLDGGRTWEKMVNPTLEDEVFLIAADPVRSRRVYAKSQEHLWISEDGGKSWNKTEVELGDENENWFFVHPAEPQVAYGYSRGVLFRSSDEGKTWARQVIAREFLGIAPDSRDADFLYAIDKNAIWHSADSGHTWREVGDVPPVDHPAEFRVLISHPAQGELLYTWTFSSEIWRSTDGGVHWESMGLDNAIREFIPHPHDPQQAFLAVSSTMGDQPFYHTQNGGEQWEPMDLPEDIAAPVGTIAFNRDGQIYVGSERNVREKNARLPQVGVFISKDGGHSWEWYAAREVRVHGALDVLLIDSIQPQIMIGHKGGGYLRSVDAGRTWNQIEALAAKYFPISRYPDMVINPHEPGVYYVVSSRSIYRSTDLGKTWEQRGEEFPYRIDGLALDPDDTQTLYMALADRVWRSEDAGMNWEESEVVAPGASIFAIAIQPLDSRLYAATTGGLYVSQNQGRTWTLLVQPREGGWSAGRIRFDPHNSENIFLVTSRQLLETRDAGKSWKSIGDDISSYPWFSDVAVDPSDSSLIYVATPWGVYRLDTRQVHTVVDEDDQTLPGTFALEPNYPNRTTLPGRRVRCYDLST